MVKLIENLQNKFILLTNPCDPVDPMTVIHEKLCSLLTGGQENEHYGKWKPAQGEASHHNRHHGGDPDTVKLQSSQCASLQNQGQLNIETNRKV